MTSTEQHPDTGLPFANAAHPGIRLGAPGVLHVGRTDGHFTVTFDQAEQLARALRDAVYSYAPPMLRVLGYETTDGMTVLPEDADTAGYLADGVDLTHGLACPHDDCEHVAWDDWDEDGVYVVDEDERWSAAGYTRDPEHAERAYDLATGHYVLTGRTVVAETVTTGGADTDYQGLGYRCTACRRPVTLPAGVEEAWH